MKAEDLIGTSRVSRSVEIMARASHAPKPMTFQGVERSAHLVWERVGRD